MKRIKTFAGIIALLLAALLLTACGKSEFGMSENTEKRMTITAENADKEDFFAVGSLEVEDGEQISKRAPSGWNSSVPRPSRASTRCPK